MSGKTRAEISAKLEKLCKDMRIDRIDGDGETCYRIGDPLQGHCMIIGDRLGHFSLRFNGNPIGGAHIGAYPANTADYYDTLGAAIDATLHTIPQPAKAPEPRLAEVIIHELMESMYVNSDHENFYAGSPEPSDQTIFMTIALDLGHYTVTLGGVEVMTEIAPISNAIYMGDPRHAYYAKLLKLLRATLQNTESVMYADFCANNEE